MKNNMQSTIRQLESEPTRRNIDSIVFAPPFLAGGVKSLYSVCAWLKDLGRSTITPFHEPKLASWFNHHCELYDYSYSPNILVYPEVYQPHVRGETYHICFALGHHLIEPHANLTVCRSYEILNWVKEQHPNMPTTLILPSIDRAIFEYDWRPKKDIICYMVRPNKHPETACLLRQEYGDKVMEIADFSEAAVAEALKNAKVFVWRGADKEGSPRPPKEALVAGCVVVGLESDLNEKYHTNFGIQCSTVDELIHMAGEALKMPLPTNEERSVVRDSKEEKQDWLALLRSLDMGGLGPPAEKSVNRSRDQSLLAQVAEKEQVIGVLSAQAAENEKALSVLSARAAEKEQAIREFSARVVEEEQTIQAFAAQVADHQQALRTLSAQVAAKDAELKRITGTLGWRLLGLYGKIKYRYLLPVYRLLHLMPREPKLSNEQNSRQRRPKYSDEV